MSNRKKNPDKSRRQRRYDTSTVSTFAVARRPGSIFNVKRQVLESTFAAVPGLSSRGC